MAKEFQQIEWDTVLDNDFRQIVRLAVREDLDRGQDWTTAALVEVDQQGTADVVSRQTGVIAGMLASETVLDEMQADLQWSAHVSDGDCIHAGQSLAELTGSARDLLTCERILLNVLGRMSGIATLASTFVQQIEGSKARIYDTRKTTPGWRRLEKYAARCGGAHNHRTGLFDAILIKDNHLALRRVSDNSAGSAVLVARSFANECPQIAPKGMAFKNIIIEIEVDSLEQLEQVLPAHPDIVLLDNMTCEQLRKAVALRNQAAPNVQLEASGGVNLESVRKISETGVDRISAGALTHSARTLDIGLDWKST